MLLDEKQLIADYEELMHNYEEDDEWDMPAALFIRWDDPNPEVKGCVMVIPTENPEDFLAMLLENGPADAQAVLRGIGEVDEDKPFAAIAMINEGWGINPETTPAAVMRQVERGEVRISSLESRIETRLCLIVTASKNVYFGSQDRGGHFSWVSRTDEGHGSTGGNIVFLVYPLVTGERYEEPDDLKRSGDGAHDFRDIRFARGHDEA